MRLVTSEDLMPGHDDPEGRVVTYMRSARVVLRSPMRAPDGSPVVYYTDGAFVWSERTVVRIERDDVSPPADLLDRIRAHDYTPPAVHDSQARLAVTVLRQASGLPHTGP